MKDLMKILMGRQLNKKDIEKAEKTPEGVELHLSLFLPSNHPTLKEEVIYRKNKEDKKLIIKKVGKYDTKGENNNFISSQTTSTYDNEGQLMEKEIHSISTQLGWKVEKYKKFIYKPAGALVGEKLVSDEYTFE